MCHSPSTFGLKEALGVGATTCSYTDWLESDLIVFVGSNVANNQPVTTKYLHHAKQNGAQVAVVNPYREPGMERYWIPSVPASAVFGTKIADHFFGVAVGGDTAFLTGTLRHMHAQGWVDRDFVSTHTTGWDELEARFGERSWEELEAVAGCTRDEMLAFARLLADADRCVLVWSMGVTQHSHGEDNVRAIVNLGLAKGFVGRPGCGLMPIRGHSGVQGGAEMGCYSTALPGGKDATPDNAAELAAQWGFDVPAAPGLKAPEMLDAAGRGELDVLWSVGGDFLEVLPDPAGVERALGSVPLRVHQDIVLSSQMLVDPADTVLLLPATTRYEVPGGLTETSTERRVILSPEVAGPRVDAARPEWEVLLELARRVRPELEDRLSYPGGTPELRAEIERVVPLYAGIAQLTEGGDSFQYGGPHLCDGWVFPTPGGRAELRRRRPAPARARRRPVRGLDAPREAVQLDGPGTRGSITGARARVGARQRGRRRAARDRRRETSSWSAPRMGSSRAGRVSPPSRARSLQVHWPEGNVLIEPGIRSAEAGIPDYNARASLERATSTLRS